jgi:hypothetical protein
MFICNQIRIIWRNSSLLKVFGFERRIVRQLEGIPFSRTQVVYGSFRGVIYYGDYQSISLALITETEIISFLKENNINYRALHRYNYHYLIFKYTKDVIYLLQRLHINHSAWKHFPYLNILHLIIKLEVHLTPLGFRNLHSHMRPSPMSTSCLIERTTIGRRLANVLDALQPQRLKELINMNFINVLNYFKTHTQERFGFYVNRNE